MAITISKKIIYDGEEMPYIGPRPFGTSKEHQRRFFGRDYETDEILSLILAHNVVLVYAQSGAGKTSIFNARILPELEKLNFEVLPTARIKIASSVSAQSNSETIKSAKSENGNIYMSNALHSMYSEPDSDLDAKYSLLEFLEKYFPIKRDERGRNRPQIIIFDQFEELFNLPTKDYLSQQREFFAQIVEALDKEPVLRVVFIIREEYIAKLDPFSDIFPDRLRYHFRLERLKKNNAFKAVKNPLVELGLYDNELEGDIKDIIKNLEDEGGFVEPIHLQVVCQRWWQHKTSKQNFDENVLKENIADVDEALEDFFITVVNEAAKETKVSEKDIREWCENELITPSETRGIVYQSENSTNGMSNRVIEILDKKYLIRPELRSGGTWYELTHDRLIKPIKNFNLRWREKEGRRKSKRNKTIIIPSVIAIATIALFVLLYPAPQHEQFILGLNPSFTSVNPETNTIYVSNFGNNSISVIDGGTNKVVNQISLEQGSNDISLNPQTNMVYVAGNNSISVIDGKKNEVVNQVALTDLSGITAISVNPQTNMIYAIGYNYFSNSTGDFVYTINGDTNNVVNKITVDFTANGIAVNPKTNMIYVTGGDYNSSRGYVAALDSETNKEVNRTELNQIAYTVSLNPDTNMIYTTGDDTVYAIDGKTNEILADMVLDQTAYGISVNPETNVVYVTGLDSLYAINGTTMTRIMGITLDENLRRLSVNPVTNMIYITDFDSNNVYAISGEENRVEAIVPGPEPQGIKIGEEPSGVSVNSLSNMIYVANMRSNSISVINGTSNDIVKTFRVVEPTGVSVNPQTNVIYVTRGDPNAFSYNRSYISTIDGKTNKKIQDIPLNLTPVGLSVNSQTNMIYVIGYGYYPDTASDFVSVIDGRTNKVVDDIPIDFETTGISVNPKTNSIYVTGGNSNSSLGYVAAIDGKTNKVVDEINLDEYGYGISVNPQTNMIYTIGSDTVYTIDGKTNQVVNSTISDSQTKGILVNPQTNMIYVLGLSYTVLEFTYPTVSVIDGETNNEISDIKLKQTLSSEFIDLNPETSMIYVLSFDSKTVSVLSHSKPESPLTLVR